MPWSGQGLVWLSQRLFFELFDPFIKNGPHHLNLRFSKKNSNDKPFFFCSDSSVSQSSWDTIMECYKNRGRFLIEAILWWLIIALPINLASIFFSIQAPAYIHTDHINNGTNNVNTSLGIMIYFKPSYSKIQSAVFLILLPYALHYNPRFVYFLPAF